MTSNPAACSFASTLPAQPLTEIPPPATALESPSCGCVDDKQERKNDSEAGSDPFFHNGAILSDCGSELPSQPAGPPRPSCRPSVSRINSKSNAILTTLLGLIGNTPLVRINHITKQHKIKAPIYAKMESLNPGYSVKDRIGVSMIDWAEREGVLKKGGTIIEATSGNTGIGLALTAAVRGYKCIFVLTDKVSVEKMRYLKAMGADVVVVPAAAKPGTPDHYHETARRMHEQTPNSFYPDQYSTRQIRRRITARPAPRSGTTRTARSRTLSPASARAARSAERAAI